MESCSRRFRATREQALPVWQTVGLSGATTLSFVIWIHVEVPIASAWESGHGYQCFLRLPNDSSESWWVGVIDRQPVMPATGAIPVIVQAACQRMFVHCCGSSVFFAFLTADVQSQRHRRLSFHTTQQWRPPLPCWALARQDARLHSCVFSFLVPEHLTPPSRLARPGQTRNVQKTRVMPLPSRWENLCRWGTDLSIPNFAAWEPTMALRCLRWRVRRSWFSGSRATLDFALQGGPASVAMATAAAATLGGVQAFVATPASHGLPTHTQAWPSALLEQLAASLCWFPQVSLSPLTSPTRVGPVRFLLGSQPWPLFFLRQPEHQLCSDWRFSVPPCPSTVRGNKTLRVHLVIVASCTKRRLNWACQKQR